MVGLILLALAAAVLVPLAAARPARACALLAFLVPVTAGMERGAAVPLLRVNEVLLLAVLAGFLVHWLPRRRTVWFTVLDVAVLGFCLVSMVVPWAVILLSHADAATDDWLVVAAPVQYLAVYLLFSRTEFTAADLRLFLNACLAASIPVAAVAVAEAVDLPGVRDAVQAWYPTAPQPSWDPVYRPASLLGHYSAVGAFGLLDLLLALALLVLRHPGFSAWWLLIVMTANLLSVVSAQTYGPIAALPVAVAVVLLVARRVPWRLLAAAPVAVAASAVLFWPAVSARIEAQFAGAGASLVPETLQTRFDYWQGFFVPALIAHGPWLGTGTLIPPEVPRPLVDFVDNGYLWQAFRAGVPGLLVLAAMLAAVAAAAWSAARGGDLTRRALGATCLGLVASVLLLDVTSEYLTFTAVSQQFWMLVGLLTGGVLVAHASSAGAPAVVVGGALAVSPRWRPRSLLEPVARRAAAVGTSAGRLAGRPLVRSALAVLVGFGLARALGFLFQVAAGRLLTADDFGRLAYALAVTNVAAVLLTTAPVGLSRFLARSEGSAAEQSAYAVNWLAVVGVLLGASAAVTAVVAGPLGLAGWMLVGLLVNLAGVTALETYREVERGLGRYTLQSVFYVLANALQLAAVLAAAVLAWRSAPLLLIVYGLSPVAALVLLWPASRGVGLDVRAVSWRRMAGIAGYVRPVLLQALFWNVWFNADLILLEHLRGPGETGTYGAAKVIANGFTLLPTAVAFVLGPRLARLAEGEIRGEVVRALAVTAAACLPAAALLAALAGPLVEVAYGGRYAGAAVPLAVLAAGMALYGLRTVLGSLWLGLGRPVIEAASTGAGMAVTLVLGFALIPPRGAAGAALAFGAGALVQLLVEGAVAGWAFAARSPRLAHLPDGSVLGGEGTGLPALPALLLARLRRVVVDRRDWPRRVLWGDNLGYRVRPAATAPIVAVPAPERAAAAESVDPATARMGAIAMDESDPLVAAARLLGLRVDAVPAAQAGRTIDRALVERWPLLAGPAEALGALPPSALRTMEVFLQHGGTLVIGGIDAGTAGSLAGLGAALGFTAPEIREVAPARRLLLDGRRSGFARELTGRRLESACGGAAFAPSGVHELLASSVVDGGSPAPAVVRLPVGEGGVVLSVLGGTASPGGLAAALASGRSGAAVVSLLLVRRLYGRAAWHAPVAMANVSVDDPALREGMMGLPYERLAALATEHRFHLTVATVPRELPLADPAVARLLAERRDVLSASYHGCDHDGYEFFRTSGSSLRYRPRPLEEQVRALERAVEHGRRFEAERGVALDRVMVFPYGVGPAELLPELRRLGFLASCNYGDKYPLEAPVPDDADLGLRPADVAWEGFPLLWRRSLDDEGCLLDLVLGRPLLLFGHRSSLGDDFRTLLERAEAINRATGGSVVWRGLEDVARHAHLLRRDPESGWHALMTAEELCLHNPDAAERTVEVSRPHLPAGAALEVDGVRREGGPTIRVTVRPGGRTLVRVVAPRSERVAAGLTRRRRARDGAAPARP